MNDDEFIRSVFLAAVDHEIAIKLDSDLTYSDVEDVNELKRFLHETHISELAAQSSSYKEFLSSPRWYELRSQALDRDLDICRDCGGLATEVHHIVYPSVFGQESLDDLVSVCRACHLRRHTEMREAALEEWFRRQKDIGDQ